MQNEAVANRLYEIADFLEMQDVEYKPRAYRKAARNIETLSEPIEDIHERGELQDITGVGESIAGKIADYLETGEMDYYQEVRADLPVDIEALTSVESLGPKRVKTLHQELGIADLEDLERAAEEGRIAEAEGFGETMQAKILDHIEQARRGEERELLGLAFPQADDLRGRLQDSDQFDRVTIVGSFRRRRPTVGDIDILTTAPDREAAMDEFCEYDDVEEVIARGETKSSIVVSGGLQVDLRIVETESYGAALVYFTGSKDHNVALRDLAKDRDWKLNEYGLYDQSDVEDGGRRAGEKLAGETEDGVYDTMDMEFIPPELRENTGELDAAAAGEIPDLIEVDDIQGDLQMHTEYSDGDTNVREMAEAAQEKGHEYVLVTDHGPSLRMTGIDVADLDDQAEEVAAADDELEIDVLHGVEANVTADGLDIPAERCADLDVVVAAMHNPTDEPTADICMAMEEYPVDILAHPQNRQINEREPLDLDLERVTDVAAEQRVALEINAQPSRLDLDWSSVKEYRDQVKYVVSTDAHATRELDFMHLGVSQARRGWCEAENVLNTRPLDELLSYIEGRD